MQVMAVAEDRGGAEVRAAWPSTLGRQPRSATALSPGASAEGDGLWPALAARQMEKLAEAAFSDRGASQS